MSTAPPHSTGGGDDLLEPARLRDLAVDLARSAGDLLRTARAEGQFAISTKSSATDVVTEVDVRIETYLRAELARRRPDDAVFGEEQGDGADDTEGAGADKRRPATVRWLIDPIDGTVNFMLGLPHFAISIAAEVAGQVVAGCVHQPITGQVFSASLGGGAWLDGEALSGPRSVPLAEAVVATGFGYDAALRARQGLLVGQLLGEIGNLRRLGSAALDLCALAAGWVDLYFEGPLGEWDYAAGALIAAEAGVQLSGLYGRPAGSTMIAGGHPDRAPEFFAVLERLGA